MSEDQKKIDLTEEEIILLYRLIKNIETGLTMSLAELAGYNSANDTTQEFKKKIRKYIRSHGMEWMNNKGCTWW